MDGVDGIDWSFIEQREGGQVLNGYVPTKNGEVIGKSGVTVATGVDVGQRSREDIATLDIPITLKQKLYPYAGLRLNAAVAALKKQPLSITPDEADELDDAVIKKDVGQMINYYNRYAMETFENIPWQARTVLASLAVNFGPALFKAIPITWGHACRSEWLCVQQRLEHFQSKQPELIARRLKEAELLKTLWSDDHLQ